MSDGDVLPTVPLKIQQVAWSEWFVNTVWKQHKKEEFCAAVSIRGFKLRYDCRDVVVLFLRARALNPIHDCS